MRGGLLVKGIVFSCALWLCASSVQAFPSGTTVFRHSSGDFIQLPGTDSAFMFTDQFTYAFWYYIQGFSDWGGIIAVGGNVDMFDPLRQTLCQEIQFGCGCVSPSTAGQIIWGIPTGGGYDTVGAVNNHTIIRPQAWHFMFFRYGGDTMTFYVDNVLDIRQIIGHPLSQRCDSLSPASMWFGPDFPGTVEYTNGCVDELMIWNRAIPVSDTLTIKQGNITNLQTGLVRYYKFDEGSGTAAHDASSRNVDAMIGSTAVTPAFKWICATYPAPTTGLDTTKTGAAVCGVSVVNPITNPLAVTSGSAGSLAIDYALPSSQRVRVELLDVSGKTMSIVSDRLEQAGNHQVTVRPAAASPRVCVVSVRSGSLSIQRKVVLVK